MVQTQFNKPIKKLQSNNGGEYRSSAFCDFTQTHSILHQFSCPYTPEQIGIAERKHRYLIETTRALLHHSSIPTTHCFDAVTTATYLINRLPSRNTNDRLSYYLLYNRHPDYSHLRAFGCRCYPFHPSSQLNKLTPNSPLCIFMGYSVNHKEYNCFNPVSSTYIISRHVKFVKSSFPGLASTSTDLSSSSSSTYNPLLLMPAVAPCSPHNLHHTKQTSTSHRFLHSPSLLHDPPSPPTSHSAPTSPTPIPARLPPSPTPAAPPTSPPPLPPRLHPMTIRSQSDIMKPRPILNLLAPKINSCDNLTYMQASTRRQAMQEEIQALHNQRLGLLSHFSHNQHYRVHMEV